MLEIRTARSEDKEPIRQIYISAVGPRAKWDEVYWDELINAGGFLVARAEGRIIGFGGIDVNVTEQLRWLYLVPEYQRTGVGSKLLQRLEGIGWEAGLASLRLHSAPEAVEF
jgi:GNAT superfamily N-acetyltransferase